MNCAFEFVKVVLVYINILFVYFFGHMQCIIVYYAEAAVPHELQNLQLYF